MVAAGLLTPKDIPPPQLEYFVRERCMTNWESTQNTALHFETVPVDREDIRRQMEKEGKTHLRF